MFVADVWVFGVALVGVVIGRPCTGRAGQRFNLRPKPEPLRDTRDSGPRRPPRPHRSCNPSRRRSSKGDTDRAVDADHPSAGAAVGYALLD